MYGVGRSRRFGSAIQDISGQVQAVPQGSVRRRIVGQMFRQLDDPAHGSGGLKQIPIARHDTHPLTGIRGSPLQRFAVMDTCVRNRTPWDYVPGV